MRDLAFGDDRRGGAEDLEHPERAILDHQFERTAEQEIANQHAGRVAPQPVGSRLATAQARHIDDIVMEQRRGMDELDRGSELVMAGAAVIEQRGAAQRQHRPQPLAAAGDQMPGQFRDQRHR